MAAATPIRTLPITNAAIAVFLVLCLLYMNPAVTTKELPIRKLASSPMPPVDDENNCNRFLISSIIKPTNGPYANAPINAGRSDRSNLAKEGDIGAEDYLLNFLNLLIDSIRTHKEDCRRSQRSHRVHCPDRIPRRSGYLQSDTGPLQSGLRCTFP